MQTDATVAYPTTALVKDIVSGSNPREYFDPVELAELTESVREKGVLQPILVRPFEDKFMIVAGERRWRAAKAAFGEDYSMPINVREMSDAEAEEAALIENVQRANMSPSEEAQAAAKVLGNCSGDRDEAAKRLGWTRSTFDKRLALMNCSEDVRRALTERKISLGIAELFATATKEKQDAVLAKLLAAPTQPTIQQFKAQLESISKTLASAIFNKDECAGCQYNSTNQSELFGESIKTGHCTNSSCYDAKTEKELELRVEAIKDEYPNVRIVRPGENYVVVKLVAEGALGVGEEQAKACRGCQKFGAAVSGLPGSEGTVYHNQCYDPECNSQKVAIRIKAEKAQQAESSSSEAKSSPATSEKSKGAPAKTKPAAKAAVEESQRVKDYRVKIWRGMLKKELMAKPEKNLLVLIALGVSGYGRYISGSKMTQALGKLAHIPGQQTNVLEIAKILESQSADVIQTLHLALAASIETDVDEHSLRRILEFVDAKVEHHWKLSEEYLELLTKSEIELLLDEVGIKAHVGKDYSKLVSGKKPDIIKAVLGVTGFTYEGVVPNLMQYRAKA